MPDDVIGLARVEYDEEAITFNTVEEWDGRNSKWRAESGDVFEYTLDLEQNTIVLYKVPSTTGSLVYGSNEHGTVTNADSSDSFDAEYGIVTSATPTSGSVSFGSEYGVIVAWGIGANNLRTYQTYVPSDLALTDQIPHPLSVDTALLEFYILWQALTKEGEGQDIQKGSHFGQQFVLRLQTLKKMRPAPRREIIMGGNTYPNKHRLGRYPNLGGQYPRLG
jgi:hypothetical protein